LLKILITSVNIIPGSLFFHVAYIDSSLRVAEGVGLNQISFLAYEVREDSS